MNTTHEGTVVPPLVAGERANYVELTPLSYLERAATAYGGRIAIVDRERRLTYRDFYDRVCRLASALGRAGIERGDRVAVLAPNSVALLESHYGVPLGGAVLVALNTRLAPEEYEYILNDSGARALIVDTELSRSIAPILANCPTVEHVITVADTPVDAAVDGIDYERFLASGSVEVAPLAVTENGPISINYTSGTTGRPKGAIYTHRGAYLNALSVAFELRMGPDSVYLWTLPMFHCDGWCTTWSVTAAGATNIILRKVDPPLVWDLIDRERVTHLCAAPTVLIMLANSPPAARPASGRSLLIATGGAPPSPTTIEQMTALGARIVHLYGATETYGPCLACSWWPEWDEVPVEEEARIKARQGVRMVAGGGARIVDEQMRDVPADGHTMGELVIRSNTVMGGYYRAEDRTDEAFRGGWLHTVDLGVRHPDGYVELRDRAKDVIISGGENISSVEVEQVIARHPAVLEAAVVSMPDERWGEVPKAFVELKPGAQVPPEEIIDFVRGHLARFKAPKAVEFLELPRTSSGKIQKFLLRNREWANREKRIQ